MNGLLAEFELLDSVLLKHARDAFQSQNEIDRQWGALRFLAPPDFVRAVEEYERFVEILKAAGVTPHYLPAAPGVGLDSIYVRDASVVCDAGLILAAMGKPLRRGEPTAVETAVKGWGWPSAGAIEAPGRLEGGDVVWLAERSLFVGRGYRTDESGIRQLRALAEGSFDELSVVPLPHWRGPGDVFHLMSILSPVDRDLAVVYSPLLAVSVREDLLSRGIELVEVPEEEFGSLGANVLALAPRRCLMLDGNPVTRARLERAGAEVLVYSGEEISRKGGGGPTCLTRPLKRSGTGTVPVPVKGRGGR